MRNVLIGFAYAAGLTTLVAVGLVSLLLLPAGAGAVLGLGALILALLMLVYAPARQAVVAGPGDATGPSDSEAAIALGVLVLSAAMVVAFGVWGLALATLLLLVGSFVLPDGRAHTALLTLGWVLAVGGLAVLALVAALL
jgi:hypothetical protein